MEPVQGCGCRCCTEVQVCMGKTISRAPFSILWGSACRIMQLSAVLTRWWAWGSGKVCIQRHGERGVALHGPCCTACLGSAYALQCGVPGDHAGAGRLFTFANSILFAPVQGHVGCRWNLNVLCVNVLLNVSKAPLQIWCMPSGGAGSVDGWVGLGRLAVCQSDTMTIYAIEQHRHPHPTGCLC